MTKDIGSFVKTKARNLLCVGELATIKGSLVALSVCYVSTINMKRFGIS
jgi:hypothetical protein